MTDENKEQEPLNQAPEAAAPETAEEPSQTIERLQQEVEHWKNAVLRERADGENLRKRLEREALNASKFATERLIKDLIPTLDALTLGLSAAQNQNEEEKNWQEFLKGSELTLKSLLETLRRHGIEEIDPVGEKLNPELHQALSIVPRADVEPNSIIQVAQKGYSLNGRVIRAAQVIVAGKAE